MKNCWFGLRKAPISLWSYNITHNMQCMTPGHINGSHFFKGSASAIFNAEMLEVWLIPQWRDSGLLDYVWLQNNSSHIFCFSVWNTLNILLVVRLAMLQFLPHHYIVHHSILILPSDNTLYSIINEQVAVHSCHNNELHCDVEQSSVKATNASAQVTHHMAVHYGVSETLEYIQIHLQVQRILSNGNVECSAVKQDDSGFLGTFYMTSPLTFVFPLSLFTI